ncbi:unnamed protein product [Allacma fusca]|uniref:Ion transport domain-containing protein n=1 Tax=Allacma fusca TaxID=39272 RepID=A0A8J2NXW3_9HEXA|nr:unnamed protein product [Allacma fusca]
MWKVPSESSDAEKPVFVLPLPSDKASLSIEMEPHLFANKYDPPPALVETLFQAAKEGDPEKIEEILKQGVNPNIQDDLGKTPLHYAMSLACSCTTCIENAESCLVVLLNTRETDVNIQDNEGFTPIHIAAENQLELCLKIMVLKFGGNVYIPSYEGDQVLKIIAKKTPDFMCKLLDHCISIERGDPNTEKCVVKVDLRPVVGGIEPGDVIKPKKKCGNRADKYASNELQLLRSLLSSGKFVRQKIFTHPAVGIFLEQKWRRVRKQFFATFLCYVFWLVMYSSYILYIYLIKCPCRFYNEALRSGKTILAVNEMDENHTNDDQTNLVANRLQNASIINKSHMNGLSEEQLECLAASEVSIGFVILFALTIVMALNEVVRIVITPGLYFKSRLNILHWMLLFMVMGTFYPTFSRQSVILAEQYQLSAFTIFLAWALILSQIGKFPTVGQYMEIFGHVLRHFWSFLVTYVSLFIAFALAFCILFPGDKPYTIFPFAFLKIFVMMIGEMEYQDMFYSAEREEASGPFIGHVLYATFVIVVAIVLMNLLVGLTVSDIQLTTVPKNDMAEGTPLSSNVTPVSGFTQNTGLQKEAELSRLSRQVMEMYHLEAFLYSNKFPEFFRKGIHKMTAVVLPLESKSSTERLHSLSKTHEEPLLYNKFCFTFLPNDSRDKSVPEKLKSSALNVAVRVLNEKKEKICQKKKCFIGKYKLIWGQQDDAATPNSEAPVISNF